MEVTPVIELRHVSFSYDGHPVLRDINLTIDENDFVSVLGPNGGGKTTLLRLILGLVQPTAGVVRVFGTNPRAVRARIGYVPQHSLADPRFPVRVLDVALMGRLGGTRALGPYDGNDFGRARAALEQVGMSDQAERPYTDLSGGERQRVLIARALASDPDLLLLDEPASNLDVAMERGLYDLLDRLRGRMTIVLVTHDLGVVSEFTKTVVCVKQTLACHATSELTGDLIREMYGHDVVAVLHDRREHSTGGR